MRCVALNNVEKIPCHFGLLLSDQDQRDPLPLRLSRKLELKLIYLNAS